MTRRERLERKLQKREEWAQSRRAKADQRFNSAHAATEGIPFGQPILVGHHSEKRHRAALEKADNNMRAGWESLDMAKHHESKASGLESQLENSIFSDDPDAIEQLQAKIAELEAKQERMKLVNKTIRKHLKAGPAAQVAALVALGFSESVASEAIKPDFCGRVGFPDYALQNNNANIRRLRGRIGEITRRNQRTAEADAAPGGVLIVSTGATFNGVEYCRITFAEKPERSVINALKEAGFHWGAGSWSGVTEKIPACVKELAEPIADSGPDADYVRYDDLEAGERIFDREAV